MTALASTRHSSAKNIAFLVGLAITLLIMLLCAYNVFDGIELSTYDLRFKQRGTVPVRDDIILVTIDPTTVKDLNRKTTAISRTEHAIVIAELVNRGADLVVFDMDFSSPSADPEEDYALQQIIAENPDKVVMARYISQNQWIRPNQIFREAMVAVGQWDPSGKSDPDGNLEISWETDVEVDGYGVFMSEEGISDPYAENIIELEPLPADQNSIILEGPAWYTTS
jgi:CHASE2 domain-containing sensor protein